MSRVTIMIATRLCTALTAALLIAGCSGGDEAADAAGSQGSSSAGLPAGRIEAGKTLANTKGKATGQSCIDCHGVNGNAPIDPSYAKIGGQYEDYLAHALQMYRSGERENVLMAQQAANLTDQQIADLAAWFASRPTELRDLSGLE